MFERIYTSTALSVLLAVSLNYALYSISYAERKSAYEEQALAGSMQLIADAAIRLNGDQRARYFEIASRLMGAEWHIHKRDQQSGTDKPQRTGRASGLIEWLLPVAGDETLKLQFASLSEQQFRAHALLLVSELSRRNGARTLDELQQYTAYPLSLVPLSEVNLDEQQKSRLMRNSVVVAYHGVTDTFSVYAPFRDSQLLSIGPIPQFVDLPLNMAIAMIIVTITVIVAISWWLVYRMQQRMNSISQMVDAFGTGLLDARVNLPGSDQFSRLAGRVNQMAERIESLLQLQKEIMQAVSHELRTPLSRIRFRLEMLGDGNMDTSVAHERMQGISKDIDELEELIEEVLIHHDLVQKEELPVELVDLDLVTRQTCENLCINYPDVQIAVQSDSPCWVLGHQSSLHRVIQNLVGNACKYGQGIVTVSVAQDENHTRLRIEDNGSGIEDESIAKIFDAFYRVDDSRNKNIPGHGLGLTIVMRILSLHSASIEVGRSEMGGAKFEVQFQLLSLDVG